MDVVSTSAGDSLSQVGGFSAPKDSAPVERGSIHSVKKASSAVFAAVEEEEEFSVKKRRRGLKMKTAVLSDEEAEEGDGLDVMSRIQKMNDDRRAAFLASEEEDADPFAAVAAPSESVAEDLSQPKNGGGSRHKTPSKEEHDDEEGTGFDMEAMLPGASRKNRKRRNKRGKDRFASFHSAVELSGAEETDMSQSVSRPGHKASNIEKRKRVNDENEEKSNQQQEEEDNEGGKAPSEVTKENTKLQKMLRMTDFGYNPFGDDALSGDEESDGPAMSHTRTEAVNKSRSRQKKSKVHSSRHWESESEEGEDDDSRKKSIRLDGLSADEDGDTLTTAKRGRRDIVSAMDDEREADRKAEKKRKLELVTKLEAEKAAERAAKEELEREIEEEVIAASNVFNELSDSDQEEDEELRLLQRYKIEAELKEKRKKKTAASAPSEKKISKVQELEMERKKQQMLREREVVVNAPRRKTDSTFVSSLMSKLKERKVTLKRKISPVDVTTSASTPSPTSAASTPSPDNRGAASTTGAGKKMTSKLQFDLLLKGTKKGAMIEFDESSDEEELVVLKKPQQTASDPQDKKLKRKKTSSDADKILKPDASALFDRLLQNQGESSQSRDNSMVSKVDRLLGTSENVFKQRKDFLKSLRSRADQSLIENETNVDDMTEEEINIRQRLGLLRDEEAAAAAEEEAAMREERKKQRRERKLKLKAAAAKASKLGMDLEGEDDEEEEGEEEQATNVAEETLTVPNKDDVSTSTEATLVLPKGLETDAVMQEEFEGLVPTQKDNDEDEDDDHAEHGEGEEGVAGTQVDEEADTSGLESSEEEEEEEEGKELTAAEKQLRVAMLEKEFRDEKEKERLRHIPRDVRRMMEMEAELSEDELDGHADDQEAGISKEEALELAQMVDWKHKERNRDVMDREALHLELMRELDDAELARLKEKLIDKDDEEKAYYMLKRLNQIRQEKRLATAFEFDDDFVDPELDAIENQYERERARMMCIAERKALAEEMRRNSSLVEADKELTEEEIKERIDRVRSKLSKYKAERERAELGDDDSSPPLGLSRVSSSLTSNSMSGLSSLLMQRSTSVPQLRRSASLTRGIPKESSRSAGASDPNSSPDVESPSATSTSFAQFNGAISKSTTRRRTSMMVRSESILQSNPSERKRIMAALEQNSLAGGSSNTSSSKPFSKGFVFSRDAVVSESSRQASRGSTSKAKKVVKQKPVAVEGPVDFRHLKEAFNKPTTGVGSRSFKVADSVKVISSRSRSKPLDASGDSLCSMLNRSQSRPKSRKKKSI